MSDTHEPLAWVAFAADASESRTLFLTRVAAERAARKHGWFVAELFAKPTLTDEEREAIACAAESYADNDDDEDCARVAATLRGVIERLG
jgi:hypothetical protein